MTTTHLKSVSPSNAAALKPLGEPNCNQPPSTTAYQSAIIPTRTRKREIDLPDQWEEKRHGILTNKHKNRPTPPRRLAQRNPNITLKTILRPRILIHGRKIQKPRLRTQSRTSVTSTGGIFAAVGECRGESAGTTPALQWGESIADAAEVVAEIGGRLGGCYGETLDCAAVGEGVEVWAG